ncbi:SPG7 matrix AAA peptidase subunit, paraplegin [Arctopsyche grandis]|uniref:SPG7 matrix AAA peptidase subunit, paraplegin n=1 Tax=Arctopsyche grandis TaxID=121162 RepID=UPI00406DA45F
MYCYGRLLAGHCRTQPYKLLHNAALRCYQLTQQSHKHVYSINRHIQTNGILALPLNRKLHKMLHSELKALTAMMKRSNIHNLAILNNHSIKSNLFHTSSTNNYEPPPFGPPGDPKKGPNDKEDGDKKKKDDDDNKIPSVLVKALFWVFMAYLIITTLSLALLSNNQQEVMKYVSWNEFLYQMLAKGEVEELIIRPDLEVVTIILHEGAVIKGKKIDQRVYHMNIVDMTRFEDKLREAERYLGVKEGVPVNYERNNDVVGKLLLTLFLFGLLMSIFSKNKSMKPPINLDMFSQMGRAKFTLIDPVTGTGKGVKFEDVAGLKEAKIEVMEFVDYLKRPEYYKSLGAKVPKGALLLGPPGCGKTLLAKAVSTEANVPFLSMNGSEFIEMIGGLGAARVRDLFKEAGKRSPCIIYIDEIDAIGKQRTGTSSSSSAGGSSGEGEQTLNQLLVEMDGMATREGVMMLASTNRADVLDKALLRPGRFDRHILIDLPNLEERLEIFERHLKSIVLEHPPSYYSKRLSYLTPGFSGADIANVCNEAALHAARSKATIVVGNDLEYAVERLVGGTEKRNHAMSQEEKKIVAYHESGHALVGWLMEYTDALLKVTIVPRTNLALGFAQYTPTDQKLYSKEELDDRMCMALGGRVAEALTFGRITTGAQNDLQKVTNMSYAQVRQFGMSNVIGLVSFPEESSQSRPRYSKALKNLMDHEARNIVTKAYYRTEKLLNENKNKLKLLAETLLAKETLNYDDVERLIGPPPHGRKKLIEPVEFEMAINNFSNTSKSNKSEEKSPKKKEVTDKIINK